MDGDDTIDPRTRLTDPIHRDAISDIVRRVSHPSVRRFIPTRRGRMIIPATGQPYEHWTYELTPHG